MNILKYEYICDKIIEYIRIFQIFNNPCIVMILSPINIWKSNINCANPICILAIDRPLADNPYLRKKYPKEWG